MLILTLYMNYKNINFYNFIFIILFLYKKLKLIKLMLKVKKKIYPCPKDNNYEYLNYDNEGLWSITHPLEADSISEIILKRWEPPALKHALGRKRMRAK